VLLVLLYHARIGSLRAGYLGVDIFFVISGYLMTRIIATGITRGTFRFSQFYGRRAKRLLPAGYAAFLVTAVLAPYLLTTLELRSFVAQLAGALTLSGNIVLYRQAGYFDTVAHMKPLLHVWSLGLEEQYYLILPATLVFISRRLWAWSTAVVMLASLAMCFALVSLKPSATFYLLPTRAWELAIGSLAAIATLGGALARPTLSRFFWPAIAVLCLIPFRPVGTPHPGLDAVLVCAATVVVLLARHPLGNTGPVPRGLAWVGDFSYSLYLVHWPIFAFLNNAYLGEQPALVRVVAAALALALGYALYRGVEVPVRRSALRFSRKLVGMTLCMTVLIGLLPVVIGRIVAPRIDYAALRRDNFGLGQECDYTGTFAVKDACRSSPNPKLLLWGDSFSMHLVPGLVSTTDVGVLQATRNSCGPFLELAPILADVYPRAWAEGCLAFNQAVFDLLARTPSIEIVVLSSELSKYVGPTEESGWRLLHLVDGSLVEIEASVDLALAVMRSTVARVRSLGKQVVVVAPIPSSGFDAGMCLERKATGLLILGAHSSCRIPVAEYHRRRKGILEYLRRLPAEAGVNVVRFDELLCDAEFCTTEMDGVFLYRDPAHLSYDGSRRLARKMNLIGLLQAAAR
jgi:peptidoglycan/LPS O-acetylase OafA/YrhL